MSHCSLPIVIALDEEPLDNICQPTVIAHLALDKEDHALRALVDILVIDDTRKGFLGFVIVRS